MAFEVMVRKWGNSFGVLFPKAFIREKGLHVNEKVFVDVVREADMRKTFRTLRTEVGGQEFKNLVREGWK